MSRLLFGVRNRVSAKRSSRTLRVAIAMGLVLTLLVSGTASAVAKSTSSNGHWMNGGAGSWVDFSAYWDVVKMQDAGKTWWWVTKLEMTGHRKTSCAGCTHSLAAKAEFLNANNQVLLTVSPPYGSCRSFYISPGGVFFAKCAKGPYQISLSATKIRFTWQFFTKDSWGWMHWTKSVTKTVAIS